MCPLNQRLTQLMSQFYNFFSARNLLTLDFIVNLIINEVENVADILEDALGFSVDVVEVPHLLH